MMFEKQCKSGVDMLNGSSSTMEAPSTPSLDPGQSCPSKSERAASHVDDSKTEPNPLGIEQIESPKMPGGKQKTCQEAEASGDLEHDKSVSQLLKRARTDKSLTSAAESS